MLTMEAYLDNSATTRCSEAAKNKMVEALTVDFGNPSSMHMKGVEAEKYVKEAATAIADTALPGKGNCVYFRRYRVK